MRRSKWFGVLAAAMLTLPATSFAQWGYAAKDVNLRAGPARDYPVVARLRSGVALSVAGCLSDYRWCDVVAGPYRGWVYAGNIVYAYQGHQVPVLDYGAAIGLGIVLFSLGHYWDDHYRSHPWYEQRQHWLNRPHRLPERPNVGTGHQRPLPRPDFGSNHQQRPFSHGTGSGGAGGHRPDRSGGHRPDRGGGEHP